MALVPSEIVDGFRQYYGSAAQPLLYRAPGRVNLIGEHTDYNLGYVLPIALEMACYVAIAPAGSGTLRIYSDDFGAEATIAIDELADAKPARKWSDYPIGVAQELVKAGVPVRPADLFIKSDVPLGSGLSSSAALEIATAFALLGSYDMSPIEIARLGQRAESQFVGMPCGIMDQYAAVFGCKGCAIQIDCRSLQHKYVDLPADVAIVAVNSMVKHELGTSAYRERVAECQAAVAALETVDPAIQSLRDVSMPFFVQFQEVVPPVPRQRAHHVISDTQRVLDLAAAAHEHDLAEMGRLFVASHRSMQYDYEISCEEIDFLVDTAIKIPGVYGARMTGGGFGGCTVNLIAPKETDRFRQEILSAYRQQYGHTPIFYDCKPAAGAGEVCIESAGTLPLEFGSFDAI